MGSSVFEQRQDKISYLTGLIRLAKCNGVVTPEERVFFDNAAVGLGLSDVDRFALNTFWDREENLAVSFSGRYQAAYFMQEAIQICKVDGTYDDIEKREVRKIGSEIGIDENEIEKIEVWVDEGLSWRKKGEELIDNIAKK